MLMLRLVWNHWHEAPLQLVVASNEAVDLGNYVFFSQIPDTFIFEDSVLLVLTGVCVEVGAKLNCLN